MTIDHLLIETATGMQVSRNVLFDNIGLSYHKYNNMLSFLDNEKFAGQIESNTNINGLFIKQDLIQFIKRTDIQYFVTPDPRLAFYMLFNYCGKLNYKKTPTSIDPTAYISPKAFVSEYNVVIGKNVVIEPNASILPDVIIGDECIIRAGAVVGSEGFEYKKTSQGILPVLHNGKVILSNSVEVGANTCIDKGLMGVDTFVDEHTKIDNLVHVAHSVRIGKNCLIIACSMLGGSVVIEDDVWIGPNANIAPHLTVSSKGFVTLGSVVTKDVSEGQWVTGNFAVPHVRFIENLKRSSKE